MKLASGLLLRVSFALLVITLAYALAHNLPVITGAPMLPPRTPVRVPGQPLRFVIVAPLADHPYWLELWRGAREAGEPLNVTVDLVGPRRAAVEEQRELLEKATAAQVDGIITQGISDPQIVEAIAHAADRGIPVVTVGTDVSGRRLAYVGIQNEEAGRMAAQYLLRRSGGTAAVAVVRGDVGPEEQDERVRGFREGLAGAPGIRIVAVERSELNRAIAGQQALKVIKEHPEVSWFYGTTALDGYGIAQTAAALGKSVEIIGFHYVEGIEHYPVPGISSLILERPAEIGRTAVPLLEAYLRRDIRPPQHVYIPYTITAGGGGR